ncbi:MAG: exo-alpha-sialidase [Clostridia bacterium]|nr:exo-alpha-sialidase [Clostridia bacterium]
MTKHIIARYSPYGREPILRRMKDGTLVCLALTGGKFEPENVNYVTIARSRDDGETWSEPEPLFTHPSRGCWSTELFCGESMTFAAVHTYNSPCWYRELQTFRSFCDDSGENWTEPESIPGALNGCSVRQGITLSNGDILFPVYWQEVRSGGFAHDDKKYMPYDGRLYPFVCGAGISTDGGKTFSRHGYLSAEVALWEPNAVELEPGHVIMYCRSCKGFLYTSESFDYGRTWTEAQLSEIRNPDTKVTVTKVGDTVLMVNNFTEDPGWEKRTCLAVAKSRDGLHFEKIFDVEDPGERWFYPHAYVDDAQKMLYLAYENSGEHRLQKYTFAELGL